MMQEAKVLSAGLLKLDARELYCFLGHSSVLGRQETAESRSCITPEEHFLCLC